MKPKPNKIIRVSIPEGYMPDSFYIERKKGKTFMVIEAHDQEFQDLLLKILQRMQKVVK